MSKKETPVQIGLRIPQKVKKALDKFAADERRSVNAQATIIFEDALKAKGYLRE